MNNALSQLYPVFVAMILDDLLRCRCCPILTSSLPRLFGSSLAYSFVENSSPVVDAVQVMGMLMKAHKTEMDGKLAQKIVSAKLKGE